MTCVNRNAQIRPNRDNREKVTDFRLRSLEMRFAAGEAFGEREKKRTGGD